MACPAVSEFPDLNHTNQDKHRIGKPGRKILLRAPVITFMNTGDSHNDFHRQSAID
jgi:hypothetical protein